MTTKTFEELQELVVEWAAARYITINSTALSQFMKAISEMGELSDALMKDDYDEIEDAVGDVLVCLINMTTILNLDLVECLEGAYNQIKDRKGTLLPSGVFQKEG